MEWAAELADLQAEASCPICQEYFTNPVTIRCGHNFCLSCISTFWKDVQGSPPCPSCHFHCPQKEFSVNHQLANMTEAAKLLPLPIRRGKRKRQEVCQKDLEAFCPQCSFPTELRQLGVRPVVRAALCGSKQFESFMELWRERVEPVDKMITRQKRRLLGLKKKAEQKREEMESEFDQLGLFLQNEQEAILSQLEDEEKAISTKLKENLTALSDHVSALKALLKEVQSKAGKPELLRDVKNIYHRYENLKCPEVFSFRIKDYGHRLPPQYSGLDTIIQLFKADVVLDPETAHHRLTISEDRKTVRYGKRQNLALSPRRFSFFLAVLGSEGYHSGRQYWQVDVGNKPEWVLGVCRESFTKSRSQVQDGLWAIGRHSQTVYISLGPEQRTLLPRVTPSKIGIFLDSEIGEISFYNLNDKSLLYTFNHCVKGTVWPYFNTKSNSMPLKICTVPDRE